MMMSHHHPTTTTTTTTTIILMMTTIDITTYMLQDTQTLETIGINKSKEG
jgi:hypothetical protein